VINTFAFGYAVGYHFIETKTGSTNGNFLGIGADLMVNASVLVESTQPFGLLITNGEFTAFGSGSVFCPTCSVPSTHVVVTESNAGQVRFVNSAFWGPAYQVVNSNSNGVVGLTDCYMDLWDKSVPAIEARSGDLIVRGCQFKQNTKHIQLEAGLKKAFITENVFAGVQSIVSKMNPKKLVMANNIDDA